MENTTNNIIRVITPSGKEVTYSGNIYIYREDYKKEGCIHFKDDNGKHHRIYGGIVIIDEN